MRAVAWFGEFFLWLLWPDTFAVLLLKRLFKACPEDELSTAFQLAASCDNVRELEGVVERLEAHWRLARP